MLKDAASSAIVAVRDIDVARAFYTDTLDLPLVHADRHVLRFATGSTHLVVYASDFAGTNRANAVVWSVGATIDAIVADLAAKGVTFERYDLPGARYADGIHSIGDARLVWFKDPDGNILHLNTL